jgi:hypothetical protein
VHYAYLITAGSSAPSSSKILAYFQFLYRTVILWQILWGPPEKNYQHGNYILVTKVTPHEWENLLVRSLDLNFFNLLKSSGNVTYDQV